MAQAPATDYHQTGINDAINVSKDKIIITDNNGKLTVTYNSNSTSDPIDTKKVNFVIVIKALQQLVESKTESTTSLTTKMNNLFYIMGVTKVLKHVIIASMRITTKSVDNALKKANDIDTIIDALPDTAKNIVKQISDANKELIEKLDKALDIITKLSDYEDVLTSELA